METQFLSRFTPSLMSADALEAIFVQREDLLRTILERIGKSALTPVKENTLLVGPRGIGKTHLISMVYHRLQAAKELQDRILTAWLREEEWGVTCFRDLLIRILRALLSQGDDSQAAEQCLAPIYALDPQNAETAAAALIKELAGDRTLVILVENIDDLIQRLGDTGEMQLFRYLQESDFCCVVATSPGPAGKAIPLGSPFHRGFFQIQQLQGLSFKDAIRLIRKIAEYQGDEELASLVATPRGRARIRALRFLAGGNHRTYVIFAPLLAQESLEQLVKPLMRTIDDLTPYYNSRIAAMSPEQRKIIEYVCERRHPVQMPDIARSCFLDPSAASVQIGALCRTGPLQSIKIGDARYYELREPLMRLSFEVKKQRGKPIGLLLDFLRLWYSPVELKGKLAVFHPEGALEKDYAPLLQVLDQDWEDPRIAECCREYNAAAKSEDYGRALEVAEELVAIRGLKNDFAAQISCLTRLGKVDQAAAVYSRMIESCGEDGDALQLHAWVLSRIGRYEEALSSCKRAIEVDPEAGRTWCYQASILLKLDRPNEALQSCETAIKLDDRDALAWTTRGSAFADLDLFEDALAAFSKVIELEPQNHKARIRACAALLELNRFDEALEQARRATEISPDEPEAWVLIGSALDSLGRHEESLSAYNKAVSLGEESSFIQFKTVELLFALGRWREGAVGLDRALGQFAHSENPNVGDTKALILRLLPSLFSQKALQSLIRVLLLTYQKHGMLAALGQGLIESIPEVVSSTAVSVADAGLWWYCWQRMAGEYPEFRLPLRLLKYAARYRQTRDLRTFMDLPQEERTLLEPLVGVHIEAIA